jgi:hypothetical protein
LTLGLLRFALLPLLRLASCYLLRVTKLASTSATPRVMVGGNEHSANAKDHIPQVNAKAVATKMNLEAASRCITNFTAIL